MIDFLLNLSNSKFSVGASVLKFATIIVACVFLKHSDWKEDCVLEPVYPQLLSRRCTLVKMLAITVVHIFLVCCLWNRDANFSSIFSQDNIDWINPFSTEFAILHSNLHKVQWVGRKGSKTKGCFEPGCGLHFLDFIPETIPKMYLFSKNWTSGPFVWHITLIKCNASTVNGLESQYKLCFLTFHTKIYTKPHFFQPSKSTPSYE